MTGTLMLLVDVAFVGFGALGIFVIILTHAVKTLRMQLRDAPTDEVAK